MHVLIVDDDPKFRGYVSQGLAQHGIECSVAGDSEEAFARLGEVLPDVILLDVMLPGSSGWEILADVRGRGIETPVIYVTARRAVEERVKGLRIGADDYIIKPFQFDELLARIEAVVRRRQALPVIEAGDLRLDLGRRVVQRGEKRIDLSPKEFDVLRTLAEAGGGVVTRAQLLKSVWGIQFDPETNIVDALVARLRRRLGRDAPPVIDTVVGEGYRLATGESSE